jgi:hypothetical protein
MKKQNQIERKNSKVGTRAQRKTTKNRLRRRRELAFIEAHVSPQQLRDIDRKLDGFIREIVAKKKRVAPARTSNNGARKPRGNNRVVDQQIFGCLEEINVARFVIIPLTEMQWLQMKAKHSEGSVEQFLATATHSQLSKLMHATPVRFDVKCRKRKGGSPASFVFVRDLKRSEAANEDWARLKFQRRLVVSALKLRGIKG